MARDKHPFGEIPDWAKRGPVTLQNYDLRVEWYGAKIKQWRDSWPFLSRDQETPATADEVAWDRYFTAQLGGYPPSYRLFRQGVIRFYNVPEARPETFEPGYTPLRVIR